MTCHRRLSPRLQGYRPYLYNSTEDGIEQKDTGMSNEDQDVEE